MKLACGDFIHFCKVVSAQKNNTSRATQPSETKVSLLEIPTKKSAHMKLFGQFYFEKFSCFTKFPVKNAIFYFRP